MAFERLTNWEPESFSTLTLLLAMQDCKLSVDKMSIYWT